MIFYTDQAFVLAKSFHNLSVEIGNFRFNSDNLTAEQQRQLEDLQFDLLNDSSRLNALSISIALDDLEGTLDRIIAATEDMSHAVQKLKNVGKVIDIGTAAITLGAAIVSMNPSAIVSAVKTAAESVSGT